MVSIGRRIGCVSVRQAVSPLVGRVRPAKAAALCLAGSALAFGIARLLHQDVSATAQTLPSGTVTPWSVVMLELTLCFMTVAVFCSLLNNTRIVAACSPLPVSTTPIAAALVVPVVATVLTVFGFLAPSIVDFIRASTRVGIGRAGALAFASALHGTAVGLGISSAALLVPRALKGSRALVYPTGIALSCCIALAEVLALLHIGPQAGAWLALEPAIIKLVDAPGISVGVTVLIGTVFLLAVACAAYCAVLARQLGPESEPAPRLLWRPHRRSALVELEFVRLIRQPRIVGSFGAIVVVIAAGIAAVLAVAPSAKTPLLGAILTGCALALAHPLLLTRGYSPRSRPPQVMLLGSPARWVLRLHAAALLVIVAPLTALVVGTATILRAPGYAAFALGVTALSCGVGALIGTVVSVEKGNLLAETVALAILGAALYMTLMALGHVLKSPTGLGIGCGICAAVLAIAIARVEASGWNRHVGQLQPASRKESTHESL